MKIRVGIGLAVVMVAGAVALVGCRQMPRPSGVGEAPAAATLRLPTPTPRVGGTWTSPILMVWRDSSTGEVASRTLPPGAEADARNLLQLAPARSVAVVE